MAARTLLLQGDDSRLDAPSLIALLGFVAALWIAVRLVRSITRSGED